jgi:hypothetical protein
MQRAIGSKTSLPPPALKILERWKLERFREGRLAGKIEGFHEGVLRGKRDVLLRLTARAGFALTEGERQRIQACKDSAVLDNWIDSVLDGPMASTRSPDALARDSLSASWSGAHRVE